MAQNIIIISYIALCAVVLTMAVLTYMREMRLTRMANQRFDELLEEKNAQPPVSARPSPAKHTDSDQPIEVLSTNPFSSGARREIMVALNYCPGGLTSRRVAELTDYSPSYIHAQLMKLHKEGYVVNHGEGSRYLWKINA